MKINLTTTNFLLGNEKVTYESTNQESMKNIMNTINKNKNNKNDIIENKKLIKDLKEQIKKSSLYFTPSSNSVSYPQSLLKVFKFAMKIYFSHS